MQRIIIILFAITGILSACSHKEKQEEKSTAFCLTDTLKSKLQTAEIKDEPIAHSLSLSGKIEANEDKWVKVFPVVGGLVQELKVELGDYVQKGQTLAVIRSSEIADYQSQLAYAASTEKIMQKTLNATKEMFAAGLATEKELVQAETDYEKANADLNRIKQVVAIYGAKGNATQVITAPMSGYIIEKNITQQMQFTTEGATPFFIIANLEEVWVMVNVFESDIAKINVGDQADIRLIAYPDKVFSGKVDRIFNILDPQSRVMKVRVKIPNQNNLLKPEMFARIAINYSQSKELSPAIPSNAIVFDNNKHYAVVYRNDCSLENRELEIAETVGDKTFLVSGLKPGEKVLTNYQVLVFNALNR